MLKLATFKFKSEGRTYEGRLVQERGCQRWEALVSSPQGVQWRPFQEVAATPKPRKVSGWTDFSDQTR